MRGKQLDELPEFSPWPARLLGLAEWGQRVRDRENNDREFEREKWGPLLRWAKRTHHAKLLDLDRRFLGPQRPCLCSIGSRLRETDTSSANEFHLKTVHSSVQKLTNKKTSAIVELGAGYGNVIIRLAQQLKRPQIQYLAGEFSPSGRELIVEMAKRERQEISVADCDFSRNPVLLAKVPKNAIVYTSFSMYCLREIPTSALLEIRSWAPQAVVHLEPIYQHYQTNSLLGLMRSKYTQINNNNINLMPELQALQKRRKLRIVSVKENVFGQNPLIPYSMIIWRPILHTAKGKGKG